MDGVKQQDSTPQNDSTLGFKWIKKITQIMYEEIRERKLLEILKKDRTWLKYELHCNVKTPAPLFFQNNLTFVIQMLINVFIINQKQYILLLSRLMCKKKCSNKKDSWEDIY
jgi:hypothetical protein